MAHGMFTSNSSNDNTAAGENRAEAGGVRGRRAQDGVGFNTCIK